MNAFAENKNRVLYIENTGVRAPRVSDVSRLKKRLLNWFGSSRGIRQKKENLFIYSPLIIPFPYSKLAAALNRYIMLRTLRNWMKRVNFTDPIIWTFLPTRVSLDLIKGIKNRLSIYYCIANFDELVKDRNALKTAEKNLLERVDLVFAQGAFLKKRCLRFNRDVSVFPFGVRREIFEPFRNKPMEKAPEGIESIQGKKIGYIGGIHKHISFDLLEYLARRKPEWSIILVGPDQVSYSRKAKPDNIVMLGMKEHRRLPEYIKSFDVCLIPYRISKYTDTVYPTKLNEYLLMKKPVVSTALSEVMEFNRIHGNVVRIAGSKEEFLEHVERSLDDTDAEEVSKREKVALRNTWARRIEDMSAIIEERIGRDGKRRI